MVLKEKYIAQQQFQYKKGGLHGLYSIATEVAKKVQIMQIRIKSGKVLFKLYYDPMIECMKDKEERVRYAGIEYLFLTSKCLGDVVLNKLKQIYQSLMNNFLDPDENVKKAASQLDNCLKSLVTSTAPEKQNFKIQNFVKVISQYIVSKNQQVKLNLITWISTLNFILHIELFDYIKGFLHELFLLFAETINTDPYSNEARRTADKQLQEFCRDKEDIRKNNRIIRIRR